MTRILRIATRASKLALWQANHVADQLRTHHPDLDIELVRLTSTGDVVRDRPLYEMGSIGTFTKEIQDGVLDGRADVAVHSLKDLPTEPHPSLTLASVPVRGPIGDALISPMHKSFADLPNGAKVATSSLRRKAQLLKARPDLQILDIRGNVETRIAKAKEGDLDGIVLAVAGLERLGLTAEITEVFSAAMMLPAVGQGALGIECRTGDESTKRLLMVMEDSRTRHAVEAERAFLRRLRGGCHAPVGALSVFEGETITLNGIVLDRDGSKWVEGSATSQLENTSALGESLAEEFLSRGAAALLAK